MGPWLTPCGKHAASDANMPTYLQGRAKSERSTVVEGWKTKCKSMAGEQTSLVGSQSPGMRGRRSGSGGRGEKVQIR